MGKTCFLLYNFFGQLFYFKLICARCRTKRSLPNKRRWEVKIERYIYIKEIKKEDSGKEDHKWGRSNKVAMHHPKNKLLKLVSK